MRRTSVASASLLLLVAACQSTPGELDRHYLAPPVDWLVEPSMLGRSAESFELATGTGTVTGWFLPGKDSGGRTVLVFHDGRTNTSQTFPWYSFLCDAGFNVCVFDYPGFGRSKGQSSLRSAFFDSPTVLAWLRARKDVDANKIAWYGLDIGSAIAMRTAAFEGGCAAMVLEDVPSLRDTLRTQTKTGDAVTSTLAVGFAEFVHAPEDGEPSDIAAKLTMPSLWIAGADRSREQTCSTMRAFVEMGGDKQLWLLPGTGGTPHGLLTHDGEYQRTVARFLQTALAGTPERVAVDYKQGAAAENGGNWWEVALDRRGGDATPCAVQVAAVDATGAVTVQSTWLEGAHGRMRMKLAQAPGVVTAIRLADAQRAETGGVARPSTPLSRSAAWYDAHVEQFDKIRNGDPDLATVTAMAAELTAREQVERFPPQLDAQLADVYYHTGRVLAAQPDAELKAKGIVWLQRAAGATPAHPEQQYWPARTPSWGFAHGEQVAAAKALLARITGADGKK